MPTLETYADGIRLYTYERSEFIAEAWDYRPGDHVTLLGPTGAGKTTLTYQLLESTVSIELPALTLAAKPEDEVLTAWARKLGFRVVRDWPPTHSWTKPNRPPGWVLWPPQTGDFEVDDWVLAEAFRRGIRESFTARRIARKKKVRPPIRGRILNADELMALMDIGLERDVRAIYGRGRSAGCGLWGGSQQPSHVGTFAYRQANQLLLHHDPDREARRRYDEIGGVDPGMVRDVLEILPWHWWMHMHRENRTVCIIRA